MLWLTKKFEDKELEALLHEDSHQVQAELAESFGVDYTTILKCLKALGMIPKWGHWSWEMSNDILSHVSSCFNSWKGKFFCIILLLVMKSGYTTVILNIEDHGVSSVMHQHQQQSQISMVWSFCSVFVGISWL